MAEDNAPRKRWYDDVRFHSAADKQKALDGVRDFVIAIEENISGSFAETRSRLEGIIRGQREEIVKLRSGITIAYDEMANLTIERAKGASLTKEESEEIDRQRSL